MFPEVAQWQRLWLLNTVMRDFGVQFYIFYCESIIISFKRKSSLERDTKDHKICMTENKNVVKISSCGRCVESCCREK